MTAESQTSVEARRAHDEKHPPIWAAPSMCKTCGCVRTYRDGNGSHPACEHSLGGPGGILYRCLICDSHCA